jgi:hypothetical protein
VPMDSALTNASKEKLVEEANRLAQIASLRAKFNVIFEDTTGSTIGRSEKYHSANGEIIVQRPESIYLKIDAFNVDIAQMTSDGKNFHVAVLEDGGSGKYKRFLSGSNGADYSSLQKIVSDMDAGAGDKAQAAKKNASAFANIRPQHFTDALLIRPIQMDSGEYIYVQSEIFQVEPGNGRGKGANMPMQNHGYYLLDELKKKGNDLVVTRRFWFDRIGPIRLARQQIFDDNGALDSDIAYGNLGSLTAEKNYNLPIQIELTRPKEKYKMTLKYETPEAVIIGKQWAAKIFSLENRWGLPEMDLDKKLTEMKQGGGNQSAIKGEQ